MRVVFLTNRQGNQIALANKIEKKAEVAGIVFSQNIPRKPPGFVKRARLFANRVAGRIVGREFVDAWFEIQRRYDSLYTDLPTRDIVEVANVNDCATVKTIERLAPDLVVVSGTNLVGKRVIEAAQNGIGIVNLHTGISPYVKGGPNCTNWCLAKNWFHLIGNTVMWLDLGIDTGNIIATEQTPLDGSETIAELHWKVMEHAHDVYTTAISNLGECEKVRSVPQASIGPGMHFNSVDWNALQMRNAVSNFRLNYGKYFSNAAEHARLTAQLKLYPILDV